MAGDSCTPEEGELEPRKTGEKFCTFCGRLAEEEITCFKCDKIFHPSCMRRAAAKKSTKCVHHTSLKKIF